MKNRLKHTISVVFICTMLVSTLIGCNSTVEQETNNKVEISQTEFSNILSGNSEVFSIETTDITTDEINQFYKCDNAYYIQVDKNMFRFQLNNDGEIESYIKYSLEG